MFKIILAFTLGGLALGLQGCRAGCTDMGCSDQLHGTITKADGKWAEGTYTVAITTNEGTHACTFEVPGDVGDIEPASCTPSDDSWSMQLSQDKECAEQSDPNSSSQDCTPLPGQYTVSWWIGGTPGDVAVQVEHEDVVLADEDFSPDYEKFRPNGPGCSPVCRQAEVAVELP